MTDDAIAYALIDGYQRKRERAIDRALEPQTYKETTRIAPDDAKYLFIGSAEYPQQIRYHIKSHEDMRLSAYLMDKPAARNAFAENVDGPNMAVPEGSLYNVADGWKQTIIPPGEHVLVVIVEDDTDAEEYSPVTVELETKLVPNPPKGVIPDDMTYNPDSSPGVKRSFSLLNSPSAFPPRFSLLSKIGMMAFIFLTAIVTCGIFLGGVAILGPPGVLDILGPLTLFVGVAGSGFYCRRRGLRSDARTLREFVRYDFFPFSGSRKESSTPHGRHVLIEQIRQD